ncbi:MAG: formylglycine-generating enzyme family protein [Leptospirales bacterium]|nr:formylglycine-generating enzyme family protein [Leptospirales bacterium]
MKKKTIRAICRCLPVVFLCAAVGAKDAEYEIFAEVESVRKPNTLTLSFQEKPEETKYYILESKIAVGTVEILSVVTVNNTGKVRYRAVGIFSFFRDTGYLIRAGMTIALMKKSEPFEMDFSGGYHQEKLLYRQRIITPVDDREMLLIPRGKFILGSNDYDRDEFPEQEVYLDDFYMDKYEVSNADYKKFAETPQGLAPISWKDGVYDPSSGDLPVLATFNEASAYAKWAGKRLPTEQEWEKSARGGVEFLEKGLPRIYPWGRSFSNANANGLQFWRQTNLRNDLKAKAIDKPPALLPVSSFEKEGTSPYGILNMAGNAQEWTSSWFMPYAGNHYTDGRYGKQYKVVRGGACFSDASSLRSSRREIGGIPTLDKDNLAGFRCVKDPTPLERIEE